MPGLPNSMPEHINLVTPSTHSTHIYVVEIVHINIITQDTQN